MKPLDKIRAAAWQACRLIVSLVVRSGVTKIRVRGRPLGFWGTQVLRPVLGGIVREPTKVHDMVFYHHVDRRTGLGWLYTTDYEPETRELFQRIVKPEMTVVDIGAQIGYFTLLFARLVGPKGKGPFLRAGPNYLLRSAQEHRGEQPRRYRRGVRNRRRRCSGECLLLPGGSRGQSLRVRKCDWHGEDQDNLSRCPHR